MSEIGYRVARRRAVAPDAGTLWRTEAASRGAQEIGDRPALQEVLFCLRAGLADSVRVDSWDDLGGAITRASVCEEIRACDASLAVGGELVALGGSLPGVPPEVRNQVRAVCASLRGLVPRQQGRHGHLDIGQGRGRNEAARLAHKLHAGFQLTLPQTAEFLNRAGYSWNSPQGTQPYNKQKVHRLLQAAVWDEDSPRTVDGEGLRAGRRVHQVSALGFEGVLVYEADSDTAPTVRSQEIQKTHEAHEAQEAQEIARRWGHAVAIRCTPGTDGCRLTDLLQWVTTPVPLASLYVPDTSVFADEPEREITYAWVRQFGLRVFEGDDCAPLTLEVDPAVREVIKAHAALRMHDSCTVVEYSRSVEHARTWARRLRSEHRLTLEEIARRLAGEAIPPRKRRGGWSRSAVRELLISEAAS